MTWSGFAVSDAAIPRKTVTLCNRPCAMQLVGCVSVPCTRMCPIRNADLAPERGSLHNGTSLPPHTFAS